MVSIVLTHQYAHYTALYFRSNRISFFDLLIFASLLQITAYQIIHQYRIDLQFYELPLIIRYFFVSFTW
jgi:hypothetical protein